MTQSHWQAASPSPALNDPLPLIADVVVIGGGILGASAVYWLARRGARIVLIEQQALAAGATGRNGGFVTDGAAMPYTQAIAQLGRDAARAIWQQTHDNRTLLRQIIAEEGIACDYREPGTLHLFLRDDEIAAAQGEIAQLNADGFAREWLNRRQVRQCIGAPISDEVVGASLLPNGGLLHSTKLVQGIALAAQRRGAMLCRTEVTDVTRSGDGVRVTTPDGHIDAQSAIIAANAWTSRLVPAMRGFITPARGQMLSFEPIEPIFAHGMGAAITDTEEYWQQTPDGTIVLGGCRAAHPDRDEDTLSDAVTDDVQSALESVLPRLFPALAGRLRVARRWSGPMAFTPDRLPVVDRAPGLPNAWFAGGFCGHGMPFGMALGKGLAGVATEGKRLLCLDVFAYAGERLQ